MMDAPPNRQPSLWQNRNYLTLFTGQMLSSIGSTVYSFALLWNMKILTDNAFLMSLVGLGWMLPQVVLGPFAGVLVDRWNKRWTMFWSDTIRLGLTVVVTILSFTHALEPWAMILSAFLLNAVGTLFGPASGALTPLMVGSDQLAAANGLEQSASPLSNMIGPGLAAGLIAWHGVGMAYAINALSFLISVATLFAIHVGEPPRVRKPISVKTFFAELKEGFQVVSRIRLMMVLLPSAFLMNFLFAPFDLYMVQFVTVALHRTQVALGEITSLFAVGMMAGALSVGWVTKYVRSGPLLIAALFVTNIAMMSISVASWLPGILALSFISGASNAMVNVPIVTLIQRIVPHELMGRVFALLGTLFGGAMPLGMLFGGFAAHAVPIRDLLFLTASVSTLISLSLLAMRTVRQADLQAMTAPSTVDYSG